MSGILAYGTYIPYWRLQRSVIGTVLDTKAGNGTRSVASYDEDATSMGVEAGRAALGGTLDGSGAGQVLFATTRPGYLDKTNATAIHAALGLDEAAYAVDMVGSVRSGVGALRAALGASEPTLAVLSDVRTGLPGGADEREGGDAAAALLCAAEGDFIAEHLGGASVTAEFLDRWRLPGDLASRVWEERFGEHAYVPLAATALERAFKHAGLAAEDLDHLIVTGSQARSIRLVARRAGVRPGVLVDDLADTVGNSGTAHPALLLAGVLDEAGPGETIGLVVLADGVDVLFFRTTDRLAGNRQPQSIRAQLATTRDDLSYARFLTWRGALRMEPPRRPDPVPPAAPPSYRSEAWKFGFVGARCECGTLDLPASRVCMNCGAVDKASPERMSEAQGRVVTYSIDRLAYSESPPVVIGVVDYDVGGRFMCELTDVDPDQVEVGIRVEMTFRKLFTANSVHNYFWKARPVRRES